MGVLTSLSSEPGWVTWTSLTAYVSLGLALALLVAVAVLVTAQVLQRENKSDSHDSHGVAF